MELPIKDIRFTAIKRNSSHVGFCSFVLGEIAFKNVAVHQRLDKKGYRMNYENKQDVPYTHPISKELQEYINEEVFGFLKAQEILR